MRRLGVVASCYPIFVIKLDEPVSSPHYKSMLSAHNGVSKLLHNGCYDYICYFFFHEKSEMEKKYHFTAIKSKKFRVISNKDTQQYLLKWSMKGKLQLTTFSFNESFEFCHKNKFVKDFFSHPEVIQFISTKLPNWAYESQQIEDVKVENVRCKEKYMSFFDRILDPENRIVRSSGALHHCAEDFIDCFIISDELRKMILDEYSDNYGLYNENERSEFLFRVFQHLVLGGSLCQFEDEIEPYLDMTKTLYKDLVQIERNADTKETEIRSHCMKVELIGAEKRAIVPREAHHIQNFTYLLVDPVLRHVTLFAHEFGHSWE